MSQPHVECHGCQHQFEVTPDDLRPYHGAYIQGNRPPEYVVRCPACQAQNVMRLPEDATAGALVPGKPTRKR